MVVIYVPIEHDEKYTLEQQGKFMNGMMEKGWKHLGYTTFTDPLGKNTIVGILFVDFLWMDGCNGVEKPGINKEG